MKLRFKILILLCIGLLMRGYGVFYYQLGQWDEQFHANVAKNLITNPLTPELINDHILDFPDDDWSQTDVWLSKPPLSFYPIALSISLFGNNEIGLRLPSLLFSTISIFLTFVLGRRLYNDSIGLLAAFFYAINGQLYQINAGLLSGDHVDSMFFMWVQLSLLLALYYFDRYKKWLLITIGLIAGLAFLTKWTMSFFIFAILAPLFLLRQKNIKESLIAFCWIGIPAVLISATWMIWVLYKFPIEANNIIVGMIKPTVTVIQDHQGSWYYYLDAMRKYINEFIYLPLLLLIYYTIQRRNFERLYLSIWIGAPLILLSAFTTKREVYLMISATPFMIILALFVYVLWKKSFHHSRKIWSRALVALVFLAAIRFSIERIKPLEARCVKPPFRIATEDFLHQKQFANLDSCVFVCGEKYLDIRFYYNMKTYRYLNEHQISEIKSKGYNIYQFENMEYTLK